MDMNLAVFIAMIVLVIGGGVLLNFQIKHQAKKEQQLKNTSSSAENQGAVIGKEAHVTR